MNAFDTHWRGSARAAGVDFLNLVPGAALRNPNVRVSEPAGGEEHQ